MDLEESIGTVETTKAVYDKILELRIANAQIIVNYAQFLEANMYFEESFKVGVITRRRENHETFVNRCMNVAWNFSHSLYRLNYGISTYPSL